MNKNTTTIINNFPSYTQLKERENGGGTAHITSFTRSTNSLVNVRGDRDAMSIATVNRCVFLISKGVSKVDILHQRRMSDGTYTDLSEGDRLHYLLSVQPNDRMSAVTMIQTICIMCMLGDGNAYAVPVYEDGSLIEIVLCSYGSVLYDEYTNLYRVNDIYNPHINGTYSARQILHFFFYSTNGIKGTSVIDYARQTMSISATGENETLDRFANGGMGRGIIGGGSNKGDIFAGEHDYEELDQTAIEVESQWRNGRRIASIPEDVQYTGINMTSADLEFLGTRKFTAKEICMFFQLDPIHIGLEGTSNYKEASQATESLREQVLESWMKMIETELQRKLVPSNLCHRYRIVFDRSKLYAASLSAKADYYSKMLQGVMTVNEVRAKEGLKSVDNGDKLLVSANLKSIEGLMAEANSPSTQEPTQEP